MDIDWETLLVPGTPVLELVLRGTLMYIVLLAALRVLVRRHVGSMSVMDLLLMVLIADAAQNAMSNEYRSITEGLILCGTLIGWNYVFDWLAYRYPLFEKILESSPLPIIKNGRFLRRNMRAEYLTENELLSQLRQQDIHEVSEVKLAYVEPDGGLSVIKFDDKAAQAKGSKRDAAAIP